MDDLSARQTALASMLSTLSTLSQMVGPSAPPDTPLSQSPILDQYRRPMQRVPSRPPGQSARFHDVQTALTEWYRLSGLTPERLGRILRTADMGDPREQSHLAQEMEEKDLELRAALNTRRLALLRMRLEIKPQGTTQTDKDAVALVKRLLPDVLKNRLLRQQYQAMTRGYAMSWIHWRRGAENTIRRFEPVPYNRIVYTRPLGTRRQRGLRTGWVSETPRLLTSDNPFSGEIPPRFATVYLDYAQEGMPWRTGLMRPLSFLYVLKSFALKDWGSFSERFGSPTRVGKHPRYAGPEMVDKLEEGLLRLATENAVVIDEAMNIELLQVRGGNNARTVMEAIIQYIDRHYLHLVLGQEASTEGVPGRLGADTAQEHTFAIHEEADANDYGTLLTQDISVPGTGFNFGWDVPAPDVILHPPERWDPESRTRVYQAARRLVPLSASQVRGDLDIREPLGTEDTIPVEPPAAPPEM